MKVTAGKCMGTYLGWGNLMGFTDQLDVGNMRRRKECLTDVSISINPSSYPGLREKNISIDMKCEVYSQCH